MYQNFKMAFCSHLLDGEVRLSSTELHGGNYHLVGADLRNLNEVATKLRESEVNFQLPTLFLAECVLVYIESNCVSNLLSWIISRFPSAMFVNYEQVLAANEIDSQLIFFKIISNNYFAQCLILIEFEF